MNETVRVVRGSESNGYGVLAPQQGWPLRLVGYHHPRSIKPSQLLVRQGRDALEGHLLTALHGVGVAIVATGLAFCNDKCDENAMLAAITIMLNVMKKAGIQTLHLAGKSARTAALGLYDSTCKEKQQFLWFYGREIMDGGVYRVCCDEGRGLREAKLELLIIEPHFRISLIVDTLL